MFRGGNSRIAYLYVADGNSGRVLRFRAPPAPTLSVHHVNNQTPLTGTGTTEPNARVDVFLTTRPCRSP